MSDLAGQLKEWTGEARLPELIQHHYGFRLKEARPVGGILRLDSDQGVFVLKRVPVREDLRWNLLRELADYLPQSGEGLLTGPIRSKGAG